MDFKYLDKKKQLIENFRPLSLELVNNIENWLKIELTYTSNAIEGNTLTRAETAIILEKGLTVGGKSLVEHLEAVNHANALDLINDLVSKNIPITENDILSIHYAILKGINDQNAGRYRNVAVRISGSNVVMPSYTKVPTLMNKFVEWMNNEGNNLHPIEKAALSHYELVTIHPFIDGNGRTARLLMNLILMQNGYPPAIVSNKSRLEYIKSLEKAQLGGSKDDFMKVIMKSLDTTLNIYLNAIQNKEEKIEEEKLLKIGQLAKLVNETVPTIRYWTSLDIVKISDYTKSGYALYDAKEIEIIKEIQKLQLERFTLEEIKVKLKR